PRFTVVTRPTLSTLVFRCALPGVEEDLADAANRYAREALLDSGAAFVARTTVDGHPHLKFTLLNPKATVQDIGEVLDLLAGYAERFVAEHGAPAPDVLSASDADPATTNNGSPQ